MFKCLLISAIRFLSSEGYRFHSVLQLSAGDESAIFREPERRIAINTPNHDGSDACNRKPNGGKPSKSIPQPPHTSIRDAESDQPRSLTTLLLGHTDGPAATTGGLGVLSTDTEAPVVTETTVGADLLQALEIITELGVDTVGQNLVVLAVDNVTLSVEEP